MKVTLHRYYGDTYCTLGIMSIEGLEDPIFHTIEKPWLNNEKFVSCIPKGTYICKPFFSQTLKTYPEVWQVWNVPNRTFILIHVANRADQLEGCIATGLSAGYMKDKSGVLRKAVLNSMNAMDDIKRILGYTEFKLDII